MSATAPPITTLTVTRRADTIDRSLASVACQDYPGEVEHIVVVDDDPAVYLAWSVATAPSSTSVIRIPRSSGDRDGPARLAHLRNLAVRSAHHELIVFLDDDNAWSEEHLSNLWSTLVEQDAYFTHSQRLLFESDGRSYLRAEFPWKRSRDEREHLYRVYSEQGFLSPGSNVLRDSIVMPHSCVDLGEWLLHRHFLLRHPFIVDYGLEDWRNITVEDAKLAQAIIDSGLRIACTERPTLRYYLGGYSNNFSEGAFIRWSPPLAARETREEAG